MTLLMQTTDLQSSNVLFEEVVNRYQDRVRRWCYKVTKDYDRSCDLTQEVFLKVFLRIGTFRGDSQLSTWIYVIARNHCLNVVKSGNRGCHEADEYNRASAFSQSEDVSCTLERAQIHDRVCQFLAVRLNPLEMAVLTMHYMHDLSLPAITRILTLSNASGAKAYLVSARRKLKNLAQTYERPEAGIHWCSRDVSAHG
jgi:RNA polymerase sigma-70 factor (ECF subfamily)